MKKIILFIFTAAIFTIGLLVFPGKVSAQPLPSFTAWPDYVEGFNWPLETPVILTVDNLSTEGLDYYGTQMPVPCWWNPTDCTSTLFSSSELENLGLHPGFFVTMTNGTITKEMEVALLTVTDSDPFSNTVYGMADPGASILVWVCPSDDCSSYQYSRRVTADSSGNWIAYFGVAGEGEEVYNLGLFDQIQINISDEDWDSTQVVWRVQLTPQEAIEELITEVDKLNLSPARERLLKVELNLAIRFLNEGRVPAAKLSLYTFIWHVNRLERLELLPEEAASELVSLAQEIIAII